MTRARVQWLSSCGCALVVVVLGAGWSCERSATGGPSIAPESPSQLIAAPERCATPSGARASRLEQEGWMRAERYPYDPRDGVLGAARFREAAQCYQALGRSDDAARTAAFADRLESKVTTDYAAARAALEHAWERESWSDAREHVERLLALTEHLNPHPYVEWLRGVAASVAAQDEASR